MKYHKGVWSYRGVEYATLRDALLAAWPPERKEIAHDQ